ncbi:MAG TPA: DNA methyltransferase [Acidimicrobiales bacterium]|nr:DNA methyltransferase [Acidimicrobiales bacterium]
MSNPPRPETEGYVNPATCRFIVGDALTALRTLETGSVDLVLTSPPFLALRSYLPAGHPDKAAELGSEPTPGAYLDALLDVVEECGRVLGPHGSLCLELGDTYAGSGGAGGDYNPDGLRAGQERFNGSASTERMIGRVGYGSTSGEGVGRGNRGAAAHVDGDTAKRGDGWPLDKSLTLIPETLRWALTYGTNPHTGRQTPPWRVRNVIRWVRPNPPVGALGDKFRPATTDLVVACKSRSRYFDLDAVRTPHLATSVERSDSTAPRRMTSRATACPDNGENPNGAPLTLNPAGAPPLDWWQIPTAPYPGAHYATFPEQLCVKPIQAMSPQRVCKVCGKPSERIVNVSYSEVPDRPLRDDDARRYGSIDGKRHNDHRATEHETVGWSDCGHNNWRPGCVLDPFAGTGTVLAVAIGHGRSSIGVDLDQRNAWLARERVGLWLEIEDSRQIIDVPTGAVL